MADIYYLSYNDADGIYIHDMRARVSGISDGLKSDRNGKVLERYISGESCTGATVYMRVRGQEKRFTAAGR